MSIATGFLYSRIGYDRPDIKRAVVRSGDPSFLSPQASLSVVDASDGPKSPPVLTVPLSPWGSAWQHCWWEADFTAIKESGTYLLVFRDGDEILHVSEPVEIGDDQLWKATIHPVAFDALRDRRDEARNSMGFKDCGHHWREVSSHAGLLIGMLDLLEVGFQHLTAAEVSELKDNIIHGLDYIGRCQDLASELELGDGAIIHELPTVLHVIPGNIAQSVVAWARGGRLLVETHPEKAHEFLKRAKRSFRFLREEALPWIQGFNAWNHGAPDDFQPTGSWMTRDLSMMLWGALELWQAGRTAYQRIAADLARQLIARQIPLEKAEGGFWGHFRTFDEADFSEKANVHHHWGHDTGAVFPHYVFPLCLMVRLWGYHPDVPLWRKALENFTDGYLLPACESNPFGIIPMGYFKDEGILTFSGPWHGCNVTIGYASSLASMLQFTIGDAVRGPRLRRMAVSNLQWIAGLNAGVTHDSFSSCLKWREQIPEGQAIGVSMITGVGTKSAGCWTGIRGTIMNGYSNNPQFQHLNKPAAATDGPWHFTDEDWIPHTGGYLAGLSWLREVDFFIR